MPLNVGLAVNFMIDYSGFILCGLVYSTAVLRLLFVVKVRLRYIPHSSTVELVLEKRVWYLTIAFPVNLKRKIIVLLVS